MAHLSISNSINLLIERFSVGYCFTWDEVASRWCHITRLKWVSFILVFMYKSFIVVKALPIALAICDTQQALLMHIKHLVILIKQLTIPISHLALPHIILYFMYSYYWHNALTHTYTYIYTCVAHCTPYMILSLYFGRKTKGLYNKA